MKKRIAILGGGMLGTCAALELARRGERVALFERASAILQGASRWSEGKIHLGFVYAGDQSLRTAVRLIPGGLAFASLVEQSIDRPLDAFTTPEDEIFLVHRHSIVDAEQFRAYGERTAALVREAATQRGAPAYLTDVARAQIRAMTARELAQVTDSPDIVAGFRVPERSVSTIAIADLICGAVANEPRIEVHTNTIVSRVARNDDNTLDVIAAGPAESREIGCRFDIVINALWEGRPAVDATLGIRPPAPWSHRFRAAVFARARDSGMRSAVICTGPFGDVKHYADGRAYLSWYDTGLIAQGHDIEPPRGAATLTRSRCDAVRSETISSLSKFFPPLRNVHSLGDDVTVHGGWVYAVGQGSLADPASTLHRRDRFNITVDRGYISVDTAKYSIAPWLAREIASMVD